MHNFSDNIFILSFWFQFYYLREFKVFTSGNETILIGVASNYSNNYPDAPEVWLINKNNVMIVLAWNFFEDIKKNNSQLSSKIINIKLLFSWCQNHNHLSTF